MGMAKGEKTKRHVLIALLWMSAVLNLLFLALLTREQPAEPIKGTYCTEGSTAEKTYLVIDSQYTGRARRCLKPEPARRNQANFIRLHRRKACPATACIHRARFICPLWKTGSS